MVLSQNQIKQWKRNEIPDTDPSISSNAIVYDKGSILNQ